MLAAGPREHRAERPAAAARRTGAQARSEKTHMQVLMP